MIIKKLIVKKEKEEEGFLMIFFAFPSVATRQWYNLDYIYILLKFFSNSVKVINLKTSELKLIIRTKA